MMQKFILNQQIKTIKDDLIALQWELKACNNPHLKNRQNNLMKKLSNLLHIKGEMEIEELSRICNIV